MWAFRVTRSRNKDSIDLHLLVLWAQVASGLIRLVKGCSDVFQFISSFFRLDVLWFRAELPPLDMRKCHTWGVCACEEMALQGGRVSPSALAVFCDFPSVIQTNVRLWARDELWQSCCRYSQPLWWARCHLAYFRTVRTSPTAKNAFLLRVNGKIPDSPDYTFIS